MKVGDVLIINKTKNKVLEISGNYAILTRTGKERTVYNILGFKKENIIEQ